MPFPALLVGAAVVAAGFGAKKGYDAYQDNKLAEEWVKDAKRKYRRATSSLESKREETGGVLEELGKLKVEVFSNQIKHLVEMQKKFGSKLEGYDQSVFIDDLPKVEKFVEQSGAAATNATLAWLGGGSLAAGGFGMAGSMAVLGGIAVGPLLAIGGLWAASKAEEAKTKALEYDEQVDEAVEKMETLKTILDGIQTSSREMMSVINEMVDRFEQVKVYDNSDKDAFFRMFQVGKGLKQILDIPVINEDGTGKRNIRMECSGYLALGACKNN